MVGVKTYTNFEVIEIMGEKDPCPTLLGINWAYDKYGLIDLKKKTMTFESDRVRVIIYVITVDESSYDDPIMNEK